MMTCDSLSCCRDRPHVPRSYFRVTERETREKEEDVTRETRDEEEEDVTLAREREKNTTPERVEDS